MAAAAAATPAWLARSCFPLLRLLPLRLGVRYSDLNSDFNSAVFLRPRVGSGKFCT